MSTLLEQATGLFTKANEVLDRAIAEKAARDLALKEGLGGLNSASTHIRLSFNQSLIPNAEKTFPIGWIDGPVPSIATPVEYVKSGDTNRSDLAIEFLNAINCNKVNFGGEFWIWRITIKSNATTAGYGLYQKVNTPGCVTFGSIIKHESGDIPHMFFANGLEAGKPAKLCLYTQENKDSHNEYIHSTWRNKTIGVDISSTVLIAMPACVSGIVEGKNWGIYPYIDNKDVTGYRTYE